jgi:hypothetical protein
MSAATSTYKDRTRHHTQVLWNAVLLFLQWHRQLELWRWLRESWTQGHVRATFVIRWFPFFQESSQRVVLHRSCCIPREMVVADEIRDGTEVMGQFLGA